MNTKFDINLEPFYLHFISEGRKGPGGSMS